MSPVWWWAYDVVEVCHVAGVRHEHLLLHKAGKRGLRLCAELDQECGHIRLPPAPHPHPSGPPLGSRHCGLQVDFSPLPTDISY